MIAGLVKEELRELSHGILCRSSDKREEQIMHKDCGQMNDELMLSKRSSFHFMEFDITAAI